MGKLRNAKFPELICLKSRMPSFFGKHLIQIPDFTEWGETVVGHNQ